MKVTDDTNEKGLDSSDLKPLYNGSTITQGESAILIMEYAFRHNLSGKALSDLLLALHCPQPNNYFLTECTLKRYFQGVETPLIRHYLCSKCFLLLESETGSEYPNQSCTQQLNHEDGKAFIETPLIQSNSAIILGAGIL